MAALSAFLALENEWLNLTRLSTPSENPRFPSMQCAWPAILSSQAEPPALQLANSSSSSGASQAQSWAPPLGDHEAAFSL